MVLFEESLRCFLLILILSQFQASITFAQCADPTNLNFSNVVDDRATLSWDNHPTATEYRLAYRIKNTSPWVQVITTASNGVNVNALFSGTTYQWGIRAICPSGDSNFLFGPEFTTTGPAACGVPINLSSTVLSQNSVSLTWDPANGATSYRIIYWIRDALGDDTDPSPNALVATSASNSITLSGLQSGTTYFWTVRNVCDDIPMQSDLSAFQSFLTQGTVRCEDPQNLRITLSSAGVPSFSCDLAIGATEYRFAYHEVGSPDEWVEIVMNTDPTFTPTLTNGLTYEWGMRTLCENDNTVSAFIFGNDYIAGSDRCRVPGNLRSFERQNGIVLRWTRRQEALSYDLQIRVQGTPGWFNFNTASWAVLVTGTTPGVTYEWRVRSVCNADGSFVSDYSGIESFTPSANPGIASHEIEYGGKPKSNHAASLTARTINVEDIQNYPDLGFYVFGPNPARDLITVDPMISEEIQRVELIDMKGQRLRIPAINQAGTWRLAVEELGRGIYLMLITTEDGLFKERVLILE